MPMQVKLNASVVRQGDALFLCGKQCFELSTTDDVRVKAILEQLIEGISQDQFERYWQYPECQQLFAQLKHCNLLISCKEDYLNTGLEKSYDFLNYHLGDLVKTFDFRPDVHIGIIGCGGIGANIALCLASSGIQHFTLMDYDNVDVTNFNRQFAYDANDRGESKIQSLKQKMLRLNPGLSITIYNKTVKQASDLACLAADVKFIVSAIDTPAIKASTYTLTFAIARNIPIILGAVGYDTISAGPLLSSQEAKQEYLHRLTKLNAKAQPISGSIASTNLLLSAILANNITSWFYPFAPTDLLNTRKVYDPLSLELLEERVYGD